MFESCRPFTLTDWAVNKSGTIHYHEVSSFAFDEARPPAFDIR